jgi:hypothetical protein
VPPQRLGGLIDFDTLARSPVEENIDVSTVAAEVGIRHPADAAALQRVQAPGDDHAP